MIHQLLIRKYSVYLHARWPHDIRPSVPSLITGCIIWPGSTLFLSVGLHRLLKRLIPA